MEVWNLVVSISGAFNGSLINAVFYYERGKRRAFKDRLAHDHMSPRQRHTIRANADLNAMQMHRTIITALHIVFPGPDEFIRSTTKTLGDRRRLSLHVRIKCCSSPEASTGH